MKPSHLKLRSLRCPFLAAALAACLLTPRAGAQTTVLAADTPPDDRISPAAAGSDAAIRLTEVEVTEGRVSAITQAPVDSRLDAVEPQSIISAQTINNTIAPTADYATIANIAPSVVNIETEGPGLSESKMLSMRG
ncbi:MAG TPA: hypothetical protein VII09_00500, partial [Opitutaceae bacterium]